MLLIQQESLTVYFFNVPYPCVRSRMVCVINEDKRKPRPGYLGEAIFVKQITSSMSISRHTVLQTIDYGDVPL